MEADLYVAPWTILAGLGALDRRDMCDLLASFESTTLFAMTVDRATDLVSRFQKADGDSEVTSFARRLKEVSLTLFSSNTSDRALRIRLWVRMTEAFELDQALPLSSRTAESQCAAMAFRSARTMGSPVADEIPEPTTPFQRAWLAVKSIRGRETLDFSALVAERAQLLARAVAEAAKSGEFSEQQMDAIDGRIRHHIESLPAELRDKAMRDALVKGDRAALALLLSGTSALSVGVGVNLAGFSAYILAAQASAFVPFMSGPAVVSTLFMLANPVFSVPAVLGIGMFLNKRVNSGQAEKLAAVVAVQLGLRGLSAERDGLATALNNFRNATAEDFHALPIDVRDGTLARIRALRNELGDHVPKVPGDYHGAANEDRKLGDILGGVLSRSGGDAAEVVTVAGLTAGDMIYHAVSIDPMVLSAADFSRSEEIADIFQFGAFAERIGAMAEAARAGAANNLRGYVSEQLVAARLVAGGHVVSFPVTSNNPAFDLLVDGSQFQVKCLSGLDGLREHFSTYPDMPVYANSELAEAVMASGAVWAHKVFYIDGFDREIADLIMRTALDAGEKLGDLHVPYFAIAVSSARNLYRVWKGRMPLSDLPFSVVMDGSIKGGLSTIGGLSGKALGLLAFGPAGALVLGGVGGVAALLGGGWAREQTSRILSSEWLGQLDLVTDRFRKALISAIDVKVALLEAKRSQVALSDGDLQSWLDGRFADDMVSLLEARQDLEADVVALRQPSKARACLEVMSKANVLPLAVEKELSEFLDVLRSEPSKTDAIGRTASVAWTALRGMVPTRGSPR